MQSTIHASTSACRGSLSMDVLVGSTGLIGGVLQEHHAFDHCFNSSNIHEAPLLKGNIDRLYLACLPAEKWKANRAPIDDFNNMNYVLAKIRLWRPREIILYSTIDIYSQSGKYIENFPEVHGIDYGATRYIFELLIKASFPESVITIIRLPALFHKRIKKNILFANNINAVIWVFQNKTPNASVTHKTIFICSSSCNVEGIFTNAFDPWISWLGVLFRR